MPDRLLGFKTTSIYQGSAQDAIIGPTPTPSHRLVGFPPKTSRYSKFNKHLHKISQPYSLVVRTSPLQIQTWSRGKPGIKPPYG